MKVTKTGQTRTVRLLPPLAADLADWRLASRRPGPKTLLFRRPNGAVWNETSYRNWRRRVFAPAAEAAGLDASRPYFLRHLFCSLLLAEGASLVEVARQAGHSPAITLSFPGVRTSATFVTGARSRERLNLFGQPMARDPIWEEQLIANVKRGTAWCVRDATDRFAGGMWLSYPPDRSLHIRWLPVARGMRRRGAGRALLLRAIEQARGRPIHVVTFGADHPGGPEAEAARWLYRSLAFHPYEHEPAADGTPRELLVRRPADE